MAVRRSAMSGVRQGSLGRHSVKLVTNREWRAVARDQYVRLSHDWHTGASGIKVQSAAIGDADPYYSPTFPPEVFNYAAELFPHAHECDISYWPPFDFDRGDIHRLGADIVLKMIAAPAAKYGAAQDGDDLPVIGISWFHAIAYGLLRTEESRGAGTFALPTKAQLVGAMSTVVPISQWLAFDADFNVHGDHTGDSSYGKIGYGRSDGDGGPYRTIGRRGWDESNGQRPNDYSQQIGFSVIATLRRRR
ncbi:MAG: hypothetical protein HY696_05215 [Deltaproteobacteria bacterium]|nr:hypothetical protein [Deltaproteobacteria bacterium]